MFDKILQHKYFYWFPFLFAVLLYANTLNNEYALDDFAVILDHKYVSQGIDGLDEILTTNLLQGINNFNDGLYRPLAPATFALEQEFFGDNPFVRHLVNVLIFGMISMLLFRLLSRIFGTNRISIAIIATLLFAAHPIHTEVVANIKSRDELFASLFLIWSAIHWLNYIETKKATQLIAAIGIYTLALFSKESAITYFAAIPILLWIKKEIQIKQLILPAAVMLILSAGFYGLHSYIINSMPTPMDAGIFDILNNPIASSESWSLKYGTAFFLQLLYLQKLVFPIVLLHDYSFSSIALVEITSIKGIAGLLFFLFLVVYGTIGFFKKNSIATLIIFYLAAIAVVSQLIIPIGALFAERFLFVPSLAFCVIAAILFSQLFNQRKFIFYITFIPILALFSFKTIDRNVDWKNNSTLYVADIEEGKESARINYNYGSTLTLEGNAVKNKVTKQSLYAQSAIYLQRAVEIYPQYWDAYNNLALVYKYNQQYELSEKVFLLLLKKNPTYNKAYFNLATTQIELKKENEALKNLIIYTNTTPSIDAYSMMGNIAGSKGDFNSAKKYYSKVLELDPNNVNAYNFIGTAEGLLGQPREALKYYQKAVLIDPNNVDAYFNMAISYGQLGDFEKERAALNAIQKIQPGNADVVNRLNQLNSTN